jgi:hypothetical protein
MHQPVSGIYRPAAATRKVDQKYLEVCWTGINVDIMLNKMACGANSNQ